MGLQTKIDLISTVIVGFQPNKADSLGKLTGKIRAPIVFFSLSTIRPSAPLGVKHLLFNNALSGLASSFVGPSFVNPIVKNVPLVSGYCLLEGIGSERQAYSLISSYF